MVWQLTLKLLLGEVAPSQLGWLLTPRWHMPLLAFRRSEIIVNHVRQLAFLFAILAPLSAILDFIPSSPPHLWLESSALRLLASAAFTLLILSLPKKGRLQSAYRGIAALFAIPIIFCFLWHKLFASPNFEGIAAAISTGFAFSGFVVLHSVALLPLTLLENLACTLPVLGANTLAFALDMGSPLVLLWMSLMAGVACAAGLSQLAIIIFLVNQTIHDPLTGTLSRRSGEEMLRAIFTDSYDRSRPLTIAFIDLDHFKSVNDEYGHAAGDRVLQRASHIFMDNLRAGDSLIRWGGEEFLLLMPDADLSQAACALIRVGELGLGLRPDGALLTCSVGLAERIADDLDDWRALVKKADARMYEAKRQGRNCLVAWD